MRIDFIQKCLGRLYTDDLALRLLNDDPDIFFTHFGLAKEEREFFRATDTQKIEKINSVVKDHIQETLVSCFPYTSKFFNSQFTQLLDEFFIFPRMSSVDKGSKLRLCEDFSTFSFNKIKNTPDAKLPKFLGELITFEYLVKTSVNSSLPKSLEPCLYTKRVKLNDRLTFHPFCKIQCFEWPIIEIVEELKSGKNSIRSLKNRETHLLFTFFQNTPRVFEASKEVIFASEHLNGKSTVSEVCEEQGLGVTTRLRETLNFLSSNHLLLEVR